MPVTITCALIANDDKLENRVIDHPLIRQSLKGTCKGNNNN